MKIWKRDYYEKIMGIKRDKELDIQNKIEELQQIIDNAQKEIQNIKENCNHNTTQIMFHSFRPGDMIPARICTFCYKVVSPATIEESQKLWNEYNASRIQWTK